MSIVALFLTAAAPETAASDEITVIGQRLQSVTVAVAREPSGRYGCSISQTTGNDWLDSRLCETATTCVRKGAETPEAVTACVTARKPDLLDEVRAGLKAGKPS